MSNKIHKKNQCLKRQGHKCLYCECELTLAMTTLDHVIPKSKGGDKNSLKNLVASCIKCNLIKANFATEAEVDEYAEKVKVMIRKAQEFLKNK